MAFINCIPLEKIQEFRQALKDKKLDIMELIKMSSEKRTALFEKFAGEQAKDVNALFEKKLILKNRVQGLKNWANKVGEMGRYDPNKKAKLDVMMSEYKARQQERIFSPKENESFLSDLAEEKLGTRITKEEAKTIFDLTAKTDTLLKEGFDKETGIWKSEKQRLDYGASKTIMEKYIETVKTGDLSVKEMLKKTAQETKQDWQEFKPKAISNLLFKTSKTIADNSIALVATFDNSFIGRQGLKTLMTHPTIWYKMAKNSFVDFYKTLKNEPARDALMADVYSRPNYLNNAYTRGKLIPKTEEQFPTSMPARIPGVGRVFKASENAFIGSALRSRMDLYDLLSERAKENGIDITDKVFQKDLGKMIGSLTARGQWGVKGEPAVVRLVLWAPKMLKANIDVLTAHGLGTGLETNFARQQAAMNLLKIVIITATILSVANAIDDESVDFDPRSTDFGKIKINKTRFDITGGAGSLIVLASRIVTNESKSSVTGRVTELGPGFGQFSRMDVFYNFIEGKTTPPVRTIIDFFEGRNFLGVEPTIWTSLSQVATPISIQNVIELKDDNSVEAVMGVILDGLGINATTYKPRKRKKSTKGSGR